jgi:hypothetical protein
VQVEASQRWRSQADSSARINPRMAESSKRNSKSKARKMEGTTQATICSRVTHLTSLGTMLTSETHRRQTLWIGASTMRFIRGTCCWTIADLKEGLPVLATRSRQVEIDRGPLGKSHRINLSLQLVGAGLVRRKSHP